jgi:pantetheine-phosphate adenylyltransferase
MKQHAIYPGSFDPLTFGHVNLVQRALGIFSTVTVAIASDSSKKTVFSLVERVEMIQKAFEGQSRVKVESFSGLLVDYVSKISDSVVIRGIRSNVDFEYELALAQANKHLNSKMETIFMLTDTEFSFLSSSMIREIVALGGSTKGLLPDFIEKALAEKLAKRKS